MLETTYKEWFSGESQEVDQSMYPHAEPIDKALYIGRSCESLH